MQQALQHRRSVSLFGVTLAVACAAILSPEELTFIGPDAAIVRFCSVLTGNEWAPGEVIRRAKYEASQQRSRFGLLCRTHEAGRLIERCTRLPFRDKPPVSAHYAAAMRASRILPLWTLSKEFAVRRLPKTAAIE